MDINSPTGRVRKWIMRVFGVEVYWNRRERGRRFIEECIELVQAMDISKDDVQQILDRIYSRPVGDVEQEVGGVGITLLGLCGCLGLDFDILTDTELRRIEALPIDHWRKRQAAKAEAGVGVDLNNAA